MTDKKRIPIQCPTWKSTHFYACLEDGVRFLEVRCRSDRGNIERVPRERLEQAWKELEAQARLELPHD